LAEVCYYNRVSELFDEYRLKVTGSLESRKDGDIFEFLNVYRPGYKSEVLDFMYRKGYEDGLKAGKQAKKRKEALA